MRAVWAALAHASNLIWIAQGSGGVGTLLEWPSVIWQLCLLTSSSLMRIYTQSLMFNNKEMHFRYLIKRPVPSFVRRPPSPDFHFPTCNYGLTIHLSERAVSSLFRVWIFSILLETQSTQNCSTLRLLKPTMLIFPLIIGISVIRNQISRHPMTVNVRTKTVTFSVFVVSSRNLWHDLEMPNYIRGHGFYSWSQGFKCLTWSQTVKTQVYHQISIVNLTLSPIEN